MFLVAAVDWRHYVFMIPLMLLSVFMILVILVQRGRGGGLTGALGGMGGQSAFGTKAGDLFTRITIVVAAIWVLLSMASLKVLNQYGATAGLGTERGLAVPVSKAPEGGLLPSASGLPSENAKTAEEEPAPGTSPTAPAKTEAAPAAPTTPATDSRPADTTPPRKSRRPSRRRQINTGHWSFELRHWSLEFAALLLSMTGHGEAHRHDDGLSIAVEIRTVNNRYFKLNLRMTEGYAPLEAHVESLIREHIRRGTVQVQLQIDREARPEDYRLNQAVLKGYLQQLESALGAAVVRDAAQLAPLLALPGVVHEPTAEYEEIELQWPRIESVVRSALEHLSKMRIDEGRSMATDLTANARTIAAELKKIEARAPLVVEAYRGRLTERLNKLLAEVGVRADSSEVIREVGLFGERSDISEECVRMKSHLEQFDTIVAAAESQGRKLEFLTQEMFRETNTIGSKANDAEIARHVIEIKTAIERMREMIQNVE